MRVQQSDADCKLFSVWGILPGRSHVGADCLRSSSSLWQQPGEVCCTHIHTLCNAAPRAEESSSRVILPLSNRVCSFSKRVSTGVSCSFGREANSLGRKLATKEFTSPIESTTFAAVHFGSFLFALSARVASSRSSSSSSSSCCSFACQRHHSNQVLLGCCVTVVCQRAHWQGAA